MVLLEVILEARGLAMILIFLWSLATRLARA